MTILQITNIDKPDRYSAVEAIQKVAGVEWGPWTLAEAVAWAEISGNKFIVSNGFMITDVRVRVSVLGNKYLQTVANDIPTDNLLSLPPIVGFNFNSLMGNSN